MSRPNEKRSDRDLMPPPPLPPVRPRPPALFRTHGDKTTPIIVSSPESSDDEDIGSTASSTPHAHARGAGNITMRMLDNLRSVLQGTEGGGNFCVGGRIPIDGGVGGREFGAEEEKGGVAPITVRFDKSDGSVARIQFPSLPVRKNNSGFEDLLQSCSPSSSPSSAFGSGSRENQGGPGSLDAEHFSTDFHPHQCGILDTIAQTMLPGINKPIKSKGKDGGNDVQRVRAELTGLVIYHPSTSTTVLKLHLPLNTRQATSSLGTLLIILPTPHQGAQLNLSHPSQPQVQTFSTITTSSSIRYLAFSKLTMPSLTPPTSGHLVTLTYNLFPSSPTNLHLQPSSSSSTELASFPLYAYLKHILSQQDFLPSGGPVGFFCTNNYAHTSRGAEKKFPGCLTGIDYVLFSVLKTLGFEPRVKPVLGEEAWDEFYEHRLRKFMEDDREMGEGVPAQQNISRVGKGFGRIRMVDVRIASDEDPTPVVGKYFPLKEIEDVVWLNEARHEGWEVQVVNLKGASSEDGEEEKGEEGGGLMWHYSCVAILVELPRFRDRI